MVVLVEIGEGRLSGLEQGQAFHATESSDGHQSAGVPRAFAAAIHEMWPTFDESMVVLSLLPRAVAGDDTVPGVFFYRDAAAGHQPRVRGEEVPAAG